MELVRVRKGTGELYRPFRNRQGYYVLADPKHGSKKHRARHARYSEDLAEVVRLVQEERFHLWMKGEVTGQQNLIAPQNIEFR